MVLRVKFDGRREVLLRALEVLDVEGLDGALLWEEAQERVRGDGGRESKSSYGARSLNSSDSSLRCAIASITSCSSCRATSHGG